VRSTISVQEFKSILVSELRRGKLLFLLFVPCLFVFTSLSVYADDNSPIEVLYSGAISEFPEGIRFQLKTSSDNKIASIAVRFNTGQGTTGSYNYLKFEEEFVVDSELFWRTNTSTRYIPPGTVIRYHFEIEDNAGNSFITEPTDFIYHDARFTWDELSRGPVTVSYHGPVQKRAQLVLDATIETLQHMGPILGADTEEPIRVTMYNNVKEMLVALPPGSTTIRRELITEGQAFVKVGTLLVLGGGRGAIGTTSHEVTHILTHRAGDSVYRTVPSWLDEGLAEYGNIDPGFSYDIALEFAIATDRLLPITSLPVLPGTPDDIIIFYGQGRSIVRFMIEVFGAEKIKALMAAMKSGRNIDDAITLIYNMGRVELENRWRTAIGAPLFSPEGRERSVPTRIARPTLQPYSLTPQPKANNIRSTSLKSIEMESIEKESNDDSIKLEENVAIHSTDNGNCSSLRNEQTRRRPMGVVSLACMVSFGILSFRRNKIR